MGMAVPLGVGGQGVGPVGIEPNLSGFTGQRSTTELQSTQDQFPALVLAFLISSKKSCSCFLGNV